MFGAENCAIYGQEMCTITAWHHVIKKNFPETGVRCERAVGMMTSLPMIWQFLQPLRRLPHVDNGTATSFNLQVP